MKEPLPKGIVIGVGIVIAAVVLFFGGRAIQKASGPEVERDAPPANFYRRDAAPPTKP